MTDNKIKIKESERLYSSNVPTEIPKLITYLQSLQEKGWELFEARADCYIDDNEPFLTLSAAKFRDETDKEFQKRMNEEKEKKAIRKKKALIEIERLQRYVEELSDE